MELNRGAFSDAVAGVVGSRLGTEYFSKLPPRHAPRGTGRTLLAYLKQPAGPEKNSALWSEVTGGVRIRNGHVSGRVLLTRAMQAARRSASN